jgi:hypothetical protein
VGPLLLDAEVAPIFRVTADHFYFVPNQDTTGYQVPQVGLEASAGLGLHFL